MYALGMPTGMHVFPYFPAVAKNIDLMPEFAIIYENVSVNKSFKV